MGEWPNIFTKVDFVGAENLSFSCIETFDYNAFEEALSHVSAAFVTSAMRVGVERTHESLCAELPPASLNRAVYVGDGLLLHDGIDDELGEVGRLRGAGSRRDRKALLNERRELLFAHPLPPVRQRRAVEGELVPEELLAPKELEIGVLQPAIAQRLVREIVRMPQSRGPP